MTDGPKYFGKYRATVLNNIDPQNQGRIMVQLGDKYGAFPSTWAMPSFPFAAKAMAGMVALPQLGAGVWVEFEAGDPDYPIWSGGFFPEIGGFPALAVTGALFMMGAAGTTISNGQGATIVMSGPSVIINNGALVVT